MSRPQLMSPSFNDLRSVQGRHRTVWLVTLLRMYVCMYSCIAANYLWWKWQSTCMNIQYLCFFIVYLYLNHSETGEIGIIVLLFNDAICMHVFMHVCVYCMGFRYVHVRIFVSVSAQWSGQNRAFLTTKWIRKRVFCNSRREKMYNNNSRFSSLYSRLK